MRKEELLFRRFGKILPAGSLLFEEGEECRGMFIIQKGRVRLFKRIGEGELTIDSLGEGDFFGETACLTGRPRTLSAVVEEESRVLQIEPEILDRLFRGNVGMGLKAIGNLASRLNKAYQLIEKLALDRERTGPAPEMGETL
ncbi:MAG: cyclic nucleotide-binding domain-containing protein [Deltaproteobacteria bacterium]|nr:cyclic nucleotide-binding domain-containing protein [Deltaproteobacteria bacterium]